MNIPEWGMYHLATVGVRLAGHARLHVLVISKYQAAQHGVPWDRWRKDDVLRVHCHVQLGNGRGKIHQMEAEHNALAVMAT